MELYVNYWAVLVAGVVSMIVGSLWYGPMFGKMWKGLMGFTDESMVNMKMTPMKAMSMGFVTALVMAYVLQHFVVLTGVASVGEAWELVFWLWLGFMLPLTAGAYLWEGRPFKLFVLNAVQWLVSLSLMALVFVLWP